MAHTVISNLPSTPIMWVPLYTLQTDSLNNQGGGLSWGTAGSTRKFDLSMLKFLHAFQPCPQPPCFSLCMPSMPGLNLHAADSTCFPCLSLTQSLWLDCILTETHHDPLPWSEKAYAMPLPISLSRWSFQHICLSCRLESTALNTQSLDNHSSDYHQIPASPPTWISKNYSPESPWKNILTVTKQSDIPPLRTCQTLRRSGGCHKHSWLPTFFITFRAISQDYSNKIVSVQLLLSN